MLTEMSRRMNFAGAVAAEHCCWQPRRMGFAAAVVDFDQPMRRGSACLQPLQKPKARQNQRRVVAQPERNRWVVQLQPQRDCRCSVDLAQSLNRMLAVKTAQKLMTRMRVSDPSVRVLQKHCFAQELMAVQMPTHHHPSLKAVRNLSSAQGLMAVRTLTLHRRGQRRTQSLAEKASRRQMLDRMYFVEQLPGQRLRVCRKLNFADLALRPDRMHLMLLVLQKGRRRRLVAVVADHSRLCFPCLSD